MIMQQKYMCIYGIGFGGNIYWIYLFDDNFMH